MKIYVGNLSFSTTEDALRTVFEEFGTIEEVTVVQDRETGRSRGFGFITMSDAAAGKAAIEAVNGREVDGRALNVNEARPKKEGGGGGGGGFRRR